MKKLIFILTTVFAISSFSDENCSDDKNCPFQKNSGAGTTTIGDASCPSCVAYEKAKGMLSNTRGTLKTKSYLKDKNSNSDVGTGQ